jgi:hypothetical protein
LPLPDEWVVEKGKQYDVDVKYEQFRVFNATSDKCISRYTTPVWAPGLAHAA